MSPPPVVFVLLACLAACVTALGVRHWAGAALLLGLALAALWLGPRVGFAGFRSFVPLISGAGIAALALVPLLLIRRVATRRLRLLVGVSFAFASHASFLFWAMGTR